MRNSERSTGGHRQLRAAGYDAQWFATRRRWRAAPRPFVWHVVVCHVAISMEASPEKVLTFRRGRKHTPFQGLISTFGTVPFRGEKPRRALTARQPGRKR